MGLLEGGFAAKKQRQALALGERGSPARPPRLPPGQVATKRFPPVSTRTWHNVADPWPGQ